MVVEQFFLQTSMLESNQNRIGLGKDKTSTDQCKSSLPPNRLNMLRWADGSRVVGLEVRVVVMVVVAEL